MEAYIKLLKEQNPEMAKYFELMQANTESKEPEVEPVIDVELHERINKLKQINKKLFTIIEGLKQQLEFELLQNDDLALAIGSCTECFGDNPDCPDCFGKGKPGSSVPDFILFNKYINPAIQKYNKHYFNKN